jgi:hypothetical protein
LWIYLFLLSVLSGFAALCISFEWQTLFYIINGIQKYEKQAQMHKQGPGKRGHNQVETGDICYLNLK